MESDLQSRYNYVFDNTTDTYNFTTKNNICYRVSFVVDQTFSTLSGQEISGIYQLVVEKVTEELEPLDSKVSKTIESIVAKFFQNIHNSLIYVCSEEGEKAEVRYKVFSRWNNTSFYRETIVKIDNVVKVDLGEDVPCILYTSFMFHKKNTDFERLIDIYKKIESVLNTENKDITPRES